MVTATITYGEHKWEIEYKVLPGKRALKLVKITPELTTHDLFDQFLKALRPLWNSLDLPANTALAMPEELVRLLSSAAAAPGSQGTPQR